MKIYFLVEGEKTEPIVLSAWLKTSSPEAFRSTDS